MYFVTLICLISSHLKTSVFYKFEIKITILKWRIILVNMIKMRDYFCRDRCLLEILFGSSDAGENNGNTINPKRKRLWLFMSKRNLQKNKFT